MNFKKCIGKGVKLLFGLRYILIIMMLFYLFVQLAYINSKTACSRFVEYSSVRGGSTVILEFIVGNEKYIRSTGVSTFKRDKLSSMESCDCIELEYSVYFPSITSRVIDKRFIKE